MREISAEALIKIRGTSEKERSRCKWLSQILIALAGCGMVWHTMASVLLDCSNKHDKSIELTRLV
jgi:hypothetical protein